MIVRSHGGSDCNDDADFAVSACDDDDAVLVWHTSGQQGLMLGSSAWDGRAGGDRVGEGLMAAAMEGGEGPCGGLEPGDVLVQGQEGCQGVLVVRRIEGQGVHLIRFLWQGGYGAMGMELCGKWAGSDADSSSIACSSSGSSNCCTVVLAFTVDMTTPFPSPPSSPGLAAVRFACGYDDGTSSCSPRSVCKSHVM